MQQKLIIVLFLLFATASSQGADSISWLEQKNATGDWYGCRSQLEKKGLMISSYYATDLGGNPDGGIKQRTGYSGFLDVGVTLDFEKMACIKGLSLKIHNYLASGNNLSSEIGNFFCVQEVFAPGNYFFGILDLSLTLLNERLTFEIGRLLAGDMFARSELWQYYVTGGLNGNLESIDFNIFFPEYSIAAWAVRVTYEPTKNWQLIGALYNADPKVEDPDRHGLYFSLNMDDGYLALGQATYRHHKNRKEKGLLGSITLGGYYESSRFQNLTDSTKFHRGNQGIYLIVDQMLYRGEWLEFLGPSQLRSDAAYAERVKMPYHRQQVIMLDHPKGLTAWGAAYYAPSDRINIQSYQLAGGLLYHGLFACRERDVTAFGVLRGKFSDRLEGQEAETVVELNHRFQLGPWMYMTPDFQYVIKPNGQSDIPNAVVLGLEISINF